MLFQEIRGATSIVTFGGLRFLVDPFLAPKGSFPPVPSPYNEFPNPLVELPLPIEQIVTVDAVIVTHMHHFDHFDDAAARLLSKSLPVFVQSEAEATDMRALGFGNVTPLRTEGTDFHHIRVFRTDALHGDGTTADYYYQKIGLPAEACGFVLSAEGEPGFYAAGDTLWFAGVQAAIARFRPQVIALNAANAQMYDGTPILMGVDGVREVAEAAPWATLIATHMDAVNHARLDRATLRAFADKAGFGERLRIPADGETLTLSGEEWQSLNDA